MLVPPVPTVINVELLVPVLDRSTPRHERDAGYKGSRCHTLFLRGDEPRPQPRGEKHQDDKTTSAVFPGASPHFLTAPRLAWRVNVPSHPPPIVRVREGHVEVRVYGVERVAHEEDDPLGFERPESQPLRVVRLHHSDAIVHDALALVAGQ